MPLPRKPTGQEPQDQEPSGKLLHSAPGKQGLDRQPSAGREETVRLAAAQEQHPVVASEMPAAEASRPTGGQEAEGQGATPHTHLMGTPT